MLHCDCVKGKPKATQLIKDGFEEAQKDIFSSTQKTVPVAVTPITQSLSCSQLLPKNFNKPQLAFCEIMDKNKLLSIEILLHMGTCIEFIVNKQVVGGKSFNLPLATVNFTYWSLFF